MTYFNETDDKFQYPLGMCVGPLGRFVVISTLLRSNPNLLVSAHQWYQITAVMWLGLQGRNVCSISIIDLEGDVTINNSLEDEVKFLMTGYPLSLCPEGVH